jgi:hypothetical protein
LTSLAQVLDVIVRRTLLPRLGYREGLTRMQLWVIHHLLSQTPFDIWDLMISEMEDTLAEGFKGHRQLPYAHWICFIIRSALELPSEISAEILPLFFLSMIFVSYGLQLRESRHLA